MSNQRSAIRKRGELVHAEAWEFVDESTPDMEVDRLQVLRVSAKLDRARAEYEAALDGGASQVRLGRLERQLSALQDELRVLQKEMTPGEAATLTLADALEADGEFSAAARREHWGVFLAYVYQGGSVANPWQAFKNFLAATRRVRPDLLHGISQTDVALILRETKAAVCEREMRQVEDIMRRWGVMGYRALGGTKNEASREKYAVRATGNANRRGGGSKKKAKALAKKVSGAAAK